jgi:hypothetical protein
MPKSNGAVGRSGVQSLLAHQLAAGLPEAIERVMAAVAGSGSIVEAAGRLGVHHRTLCRWRAPGGLLASIGVSFVSPYHDSRVTPKARKKATSEKARQSCHTKNVANRNNPDSAVTPGKPRSPKSSQKSRVTGLA